MSSLRLQQQAPGAAGQPFNSHGLDKAMVANFPLMRYSSARAAKAGRESVDCSVCLNEFQENEKVRILPNCGHGFHSDCIDTWLLSHSTCPLCRISLAPSPADVQIVMASPTAQTTDAILPVNPADAQSRDSLILVQIAERNGLTEGVSDRATSRNSDSFTKAAQDAELLSSTPKDGGGDGPTSSRTKKITTTSQSMEPLQPISTSNTGEKQDAHLLASAHMGAEAAVEDNIHSGSFSSASELCGDARTITTDQEHFFMPRSDSLLNDNETRNEERGWVSIDLEATTESTSSFHSQTQQTDSPTDQTLPTKQTLELRLEVFEDKCSCDG
ncbi:hypothetical protein O6H91_11G031700 [Diphasiastrum complanatum]|nr:hypothetical protein O6H91_11G031700 [Diphasiastrum complanatum]